MVLCEKYPRHKDTLFSVAGLKYVGLFDPHIKYQRVGQPMWSRTRTKERAPLMINCSKSPGFCIPMVPGLSGGHVTSSQRFSSRLGES